MLVLKDKKRSEIVLCLISMLVGVLFLGVSVYYGTAPVNTLVHGNGVDLYYCGTVFSNDVPAPEEYEANRYEELICTRMMSRAGMLTYVFMGPGIVWLLGGFLSLFWLRPILPDYNLLTNKDLDEKWAKEHEE